MRGGVNGFCIEMKDSSGRSRVGRKEVIFGDQGFSIRDFGNWVIGI